MSQSPFSAVTLAPADPILGLRRNPALVEMLDQAGAHTVTTVSELNVREKHVNPVQDRLLGGVIIGGPSRDRTEDRRIKS